ncbi:hypothetical protein FAO40_25795, partial [Klebsiella pneumoniae subsp. pneumoniae]
SASAFLPVVEKRGRETLYSTSCIATGFWGGGGGGGAGARRGQPGPSPATPHRRRWPRCSGSAGKAR